MKKFAVLFVIAVICCGVGKAQYVNIPNLSFRQHLQSRYPSCFNTTGQLDTTCTDIINEHTLTLLSIGADTNRLEGLRYFKNLVNLSISASYVRDLYELPGTVENLNLDGLQYITSLPVLPPNLKKLTCYLLSALQNFPALPQSLDTLNAANCYEISQLPSLPLSLKYLRCTENNISSLPSLPISLQELYCGGFLVSQITSLPSLPANLKVLECNGSQLLTSLPVLPTGLERLKCSRNNLTSLPSLPGSLVFLDCNENYVLASLPALPANLQELQCNNNQLSSIPTLSPGLRILNCGGNPLQFTSSTSFPVLPNSLIELYCYRNNLTQLPVLTNTNLIYLDCSSNQLTNLSALPSSLKGLGVSSNHLTYLPALSDSLISFNCEFNNIIQLPALPDSLRYFYCGGNQLSALPPLPPSLYWFNCNNNNLTSLPELPGTLSMLYCGGNNIYCLPKIPAFIRNPNLENHLMINLDDDKIKCIPNYVPGLRIQNRNSNFFDLPLCNPTNNINQCQSFPVMQGIVFFDNNNNGVKDAGEPDKKNVRVNLSNNRYSFSNNNGQYEIGADSIGNYSLTASAPRYFNYAPAAYNYNFTNYDTLVTGNFALQANTIIDELTLHITPINWAARPGFSFPYLISYENIGTTNLSPNIIFDYDETRLTYNSSSVAGVVDNTSTLTFSTGSLPPGQSGSFIGYFNLKTTAVIGDSLRSNATMSAGAYAITDNNTVPIRGAFDPNDKQATPQLSPSQVANGNYIDYTIRFQNTGTDTAFNIVISDTLSEGLQANTLQMITSSHNCKATVKDNIVFFEFLNILLPDSNINELKSHGFVSFKIKPQSTVTVNTTIPNKAAIYFDYNTPVITNTAGTLIKDFIVVPLKLVSFSAVPQMDNTTTLYWNTANEINTKQFVIEQSNDGVRFNAVKNVMAKGRANNNYSSSVNEAGNSLVYYRLKIVDNDGSFSYSPIIKIDRRKNTSGIVVQANPVKDFIIINTTDRSLNNTTASIINMQGAVVKSFIVKEGSQAIDIKALPAGIYYLKTQSGSCRILVQ